VESGIAIPTLIACGLGPILTAVGQTVIFGDRPDARTLIALTVGTIAGGVLMLAAVTGLRGDDQHRCCSPS